MQQHNMFLSGPFSRAAALASSIIIALPSVASAETLVLPFGQEHSSVVTEAPQEGKYDLDYCLYFAIDMSGSIQNGFSGQMDRNTASPEYVEALDEWKIMMHGIAEALRSEEFLAAVEHNYHGRIALNYDFIIASDWYGRMPRDWLIIEDEQSAEAAAQVFEGLVEARRLSAGGTNILDTLEYAMDQVMDCPTADPYVRRTIDIKFDGYDDLFKEGITSLYGAPERHGGTPPSQFEDEVRAYGEASLAMAEHNRRSAELLNRAADEWIRINALTINVDHSMEVRDWVMTLDDYADEYISNWWVYPVSKWEDFADAMHRKLIDDISWNQTDPVETPLSPNMPSSPSGGVDQAALYRDEYNIAG